MLFFSNCSEAGWRENVHENEKSAEASTGEGDQMVRLSLVDAEMLGRRESCQLSSR